MQLVLMYLDEVFKAIKMFETFENNQKQTKTPWLVFATAAFCFTVFLFYIDEGNYSLKGFAKWYTWIVLLIYAIPQVLTQFVFFKLLRNRLNNKERTLFSVLLGLFFGAALVICSFIFLG